MPAPKKVLCIQDLSSVGRCSLGVIVPTLSAMGIQVYALPVALLSAHLGGWGKPALQDETDFVEATLQHFEELGLAYDAVLSGYLTNTRQANSVLKSFVLPKNTPLKICDPVLGDDGKLYAKSELALSMKTLARQADVITPNPTESALLLDLPMTDTTFTLQTAKERVHALAELGPSVIITGADVEGEKKCIGYDKKANHFFMVDLHYVPEKYPGTGDLFTSILTGSLLQEKTLEEAARTSIQFLEKVVHYTFEQKGEPRQGVYLELFLKDLIP